MKKTQFKAMVKEIIKEVISEMETPDVDGTEVDDSPLPPSKEDGFKGPTAASDKKWRGKMRTLDKIKQEPGFKDSLSKLRARQGDA